jgi:hypothetical protein
MASSGERIMNALVPENTMTRRIIFLAAAVLAGGCAYRPVPVSLAGDPPSIRALAGEWNGTYRGSESNRVGNILFTITAGDSAFGDVMMDTPAGMPVLQPADDPTAHRLHARSARFLAVRFVDIVGGEVEGALEPYVAPDCDCTVQTVFRGIVRGDTIRGTFLTRSPGWPTQHGVWSVARRR